VVPSSSGQRSIQRDASCLDLWQRRSRQYNDSVSARRTEGGPRFAFKLPGSGISIPDWSGKSPNRILPLSNAAFSDMAMVSHLFSVSYQVRPSSTEASSYCVIVIFSNDHQARPIIPGCTRPPYNYLCNVDESAGGGTLEKARPTSCKSDTHTLR